MTPVISPWVFYLMPLCEEVKLFTSLLGVLGCMASAIVVGVRIYNQTSKWGDENVAKTMVSVQKIVIPIAIVGTILGTFIPSESTITKMLIAQNVTHERVEMATDTVESVYEDIMGLFEEVNE